MIFPAYSINTHPVLLHSAGQTKLPQHCIYEPLQIDRPSGRTLWVLGLRPKPTLAIAISPPAPMDAVVNRSERDASKMFTRQMDPAAKQNLCTL